MGKGQDARRSLITPEGGGEKIDIKRVRPVGRDTGNVQPWLGGLSALDSRKKDKLIPMMSALITHLKDGERPVASAAPGSYTYLPAPETLRTLV